MRSVNSRPTSLHLLDGRAGIFTLAAFSAGLISSLPPMMPTAHAQEIDAEARVSGPIVSILQPQYADQLKGDVQVLIGIKAGKAAPQSIEMFVDETSATDGPLPLGALPSSNFSWDTRKYTDGPHKLTVIITDAQGFRGQSEVVVYINNKRKVDLSPPALKWLNVKEGDTWRGEVNVQLKVVDDFGVKMLFVMLNPAATPLKKPAAFSWFLNRPPYTVKFDTRNTADGLYVLRAIAFDALDNEGATPALQIGISNRSINPTPFAAPMLIPVTPSAGTVENPETGNDVIVTGPDKTDQAEVSATPQPSNDTAGTNDRFVGPPLPNQSPADADVPVKTPTPSVATPNNPRIIKPHNGDGVGTQRPLVSSPPPAAIPTRVNPPVTNGNATPHKSTQPNRVAVVKGPKRPTQSGVPTVDSVESPAFDGSITPPRDSQFTTVDRSRLNSRILPPVMPSERIARIARNSTRSAPSLSSASNGRGSISRIIKSKPILMARLPKERGRVVMPMPPSQLPSVSVPTPNGTAGLTPLLTDLTNVQGSPTAPSPAPLFPNPSLNVAPESRPAAPKHFAFVPPLTAPTRAARAAITVMPLAGTVAAAHIVKSARTLSAVARDLKMPVQLLASANHLPVGATLKAGQKLVLPQPLQVSYQGQLVTGDVASMMVGSTGVTPFRFLFEKQGGKLQWDGKHQRVTARNATHQVTLSIGSRVAGVNRKDVMMDLAAFLVSGRTMVPLRFFEKALQASVEWEPATGRLFIAMRSEG